MSKTLKKSANSKKGKKPILKKKTVQRKKKVVRKPNKKSTSNNPNDLSSLFKKLKDDLRQSDDHITGRDAVLSISQLVTIYLLEVNEKIEHFELPDYVKFSKIYAMCKKDDKQNASDQMDKIFEALHDNENTKEAFITKPKYKKYATFKKLVIGIYEFFENMDEEHKKKLKESGDILGQEYEELLRTSLVGRDDGQFFTNRNAVKLIIDVIDPHLGATIYDPTCGTGGFIIYAFMHILNQIKQKYPEYEDTKVYAELCNKTFYGCDIDQNVMEILHSNLVLHDIKHNKHFQNINTIKDNQEWNQYEIVIGNFPFGKKGDKMFNPKLKDENAALLEYYGHPSSVIPLLLLKHTMNILVEGGRAGVIVTTGELSNTGNDYNYFRKELVESNTLTKILMLPKGLFENAKGVSTAVICFTKGGKTDKVEFHDVPDIKCDKMNLIRTVTKVQIKKALYSLDPQSFDEEEMVDYGDIPIMKMGDFIIFPKGKKRLAAEAKEIGIYKFFTCSLEDKHYSDTYDYEEEALIINAINGSGKCNIHMAEKYSLTGNNIHFSINSKHMILKYLYFYLKSNIRLLERGFMGTNQKKITIDYISKIKIPVPPITTQKKIVEYLDPLYGQIKQFEIAAELEKLSMKSAMRALLFKYSHEVMKLGDVIQVETGKYVKKNDLIEGPYDIYGGGDTSGKINEFNRTDKLVIAKDGVSEKCVRFVTGKFFLNHHGWTFEVNEKKRVIEKNIDYFLLNNQAKIFSLAKGTAQKGINQDNFYNKISIQIPSKEHQQEIIKLMEEKESLIKHLEKSIADAKENIQIIMNGFLKNTPAPEQKKKPKQVRKKDISAALAVLESDEEANEAESEVDMEVYSKKSKPTKVVSKTTTSKSEVDDCIEI